MASEFDSGNDHPSLEEPTQRNGTYDSEGGYIVAWTHRWPDCDRNRDMLSGSFGIPAVYYATGPTFETLTAESVMGGGSRSTVSPDKSGRI